VPSLKIATACLYLLTLLLAAAKGGVIAAGLFLVGAFMIGVLAFKQSPSFYFGYVWLIWFTAPEVRRFIDFFAGFSQQSLVMISPLLVTLISGAVLFQKRNTLSYDLPKKEMTPFILVALSLVMAFCVGLFNIGLSPAVFDLLNWLLPILMAFFVVRHYGDYPELKKATQTIMFWGVLVTGVYGVIQYFVMPPWDAAWMMGAKMASIGQPVPMGVRVFSMLNAPGPFASVMMSGLILLFSVQSRFKIVAIGFGYISFMLSLVRSAWGGWLLALIILASKASLRLKTNILMGLVLTALVSVPLVTMTPLAEPILTRFETLGNLEEDSSFQARSTFYQDFGSVAIANPMGIGLGATGLGTKLSDNKDLMAYLNFDSGVMNLIFVLGWAGTLLYLLGLCMLFLRSVPPSGGQDLFWIGCYALACSNLFQLPFANILTGLNGIMVWSFAACSYAAKLYHQQSKDT
jgi:hypothetical protein